jgi:serine/threonine protein kinase
VSSVPQSHQSLAEYEVGRVVAERYEILATIGKGASGTVYRARDLYVDTSDEIVALKAIHPHLHGDKQIFGRFRREVEILRRLKGPNLCQLLDCIEEDGLLLISLEHVDGPALDDYLREHGPLPISEVIAIMTQVCTAMSAAHQCDVIHRDLKPSNVLIEGVRRDGEADSDGAPLSFLRELRVRVVDFGLAKMVAGDMTGTALTEVDMIFGTPDYMSPEQVAGDELDHRSDIYSAGVMLYEMVAGRVPFDTPGPLTTMAAHLNQEAPMPSSVAPDRSIPRGLERCIMRALSKSPAARQATAAELAQAIARFEEEEPPAAEEDSADLGSAATAVGTTMQSFKNAALEAAKEKGAKVRVVVREPGAPASSDPPKRQYGPPTPRPIVATEGERKLWLVVAVIVAVIALAGGVWLGVR